MPILTVDLTQLGLPVDDAAGWVESVDSLGNTLPVVATPDGLAFGSRALEFSLAGVATIDLPSTSVLKPTGVRYRVYVTREDAATAPVSIGPFLFTAAGNLHAIAELPPADVVAALTVIRDSALTQINAKVSQAQAAQTAATSAAATAASDAAAALGPLLGGYVTSAEAAAERAEEVAGLATVNDAVALALADGIEGGGP